MGLRRQRASDNAGQSAFETGISRYLMPRCNVSLHEPQWEKGLPTAFTVIPEFDHEAGEFLPYRTSAEPTISSLGSFRMPLPIVKWVGTTDKKKKFSGILYDPAANRESHGALAEDNPYNILFSMCKNAAYDGREFKTYRNKTVDTSVWLKYFTGKREVRAFSKPQMGSFIPCVLYTNRGKPCTKGGVPLGLGNDDSPQMMLLTERATEGFEAQLCETTDSHRSDGEPDDYDRMFVYGDITRIDGGKFVVLANPKEHEFSALTRNEDDDQVLREPAKLEVPPYVTAFFDEIVVKDEDKRSMRYQPDISSYMDVIERNAIDWFAEDLFQIPTIDQLIGWLVDAFAPTLELLDYGFQNYPEYQNHEILQKAFKKTMQVFVPGASDGPDDEGPGDEIVDANPGKGPKPKPGEESRSQRMSSADAASKAAHGKTRGGRSAYDAVTNDIASTASGDSEEASKAKKPVVKKVIRRRKS